VQDLLDAKILRQKIEVALAEKNVWLERVYGVPPLELEQLAGQLETFAQRIRPYVADTSLLVDRALHEGREVLLEGAQGTLLDLDHGTYPFVTSSSTVAANAATGVGIGPTRIDQVIGVAKAYVTRVGEGPFPTEIEGPDQQRMCDLGGEIGTVTGRVRRCGWLDLEDIAARLERVAHRLRPYVADTSLLVDRALRDGRFVLFEGAQGTLLDLDHGTYPFVTSSNPVASEAATGIGIGPNRIDAVVGVAKAYVTRVGEGPFPTEIEGADQERVRDLGGEFGTVTGRVRRCGWLDIVALRYAVRLNGITSLALTKLDVLSAFDDLPVCTAYRLRDGSVTEEFPAHQSDFHHAAPVYETLTGWKEQLDGVGSVDELPDAARAYVEFVERQLEVEVSLIGTGAERAAVLSPRGLEAVARP
jgi:adenylosuccinate synthase